MSTIGYCANACDSITVQCMLPLVNTLTYVYRMSKLLYAVLCNLAGEQGESTRARAGGTVTMYCIYVIFASEARSPIELHNKLLFDYSCLMTINASSNES